MVRRGKNGKRGMIERMKGRGQQEEKEERRNRNKEGVGNIKGK